MEKVLCEKHARPCFLKTGIRDGPSKGKSFYVCGVPDQQRCGFVLPAKLCPSHCLVHEEYIVDLQVLIQQQRTDSYRLFYRCSKTKLEGKQWCGSVPWQESKAATVPSKPQSQHGSELLQNHQGQRNPFKLLDKNHEPLFLKELNDKSALKKEEVETESLDDKDLQNVSPPAVRKKLPIQIKNYQLQKECEGLSRKGIEAQTKSREAANEVEKKASLDTPGHNASKKLDGNSEHKSQEAAVRSAEVNWKKEERSNQSLPSFISQTISAKSAREEPLRKEELDTHRDKTAPVKINDHQGTEAKTLMPGELAVGQKLPDLPKRNSYQKELASLTKENPEKASTATLPGITPEEKNHVHKNVSSNNHDVLAFSKMDDGQALNSSQEKDHSLKKCSSVTQEMAQSVDSKALHNQLSAQLRHKKSTLKMVKLQALPDGGERLIKQVQELELALRSLNLETEESLKEGEESSNIKHQDIPVKPFSKSSIEQSSSMAAKKPQLLQEHQAPLGPSLYHDDKGGGQMKALYGGRMTEDRLQAVYDATCVAINQLHKSLESCPTEETVAEDPPGLKVSLLLHQKQALAWLLWRESQKPCGGILADDMGLGKTLAMIALILSQKHLQEEKVKEEPLRIWKSRQDSTVIFSRGTLIICPASLIHHWKKEIERHVRSRKLKISLYHGPNRIKNTTVLSEYDIVITTYSIMAKEIPVQKEEANTADENHCVQDKSLPFSPLPWIHWARIILDEAHNIKNPKVQASEAACKLRATARWAVTGTPIQNNLLDMYSLLRFLQCSPFDEFKVWKNQVDNNTRKGGERLAILTRSLLLRRTKDQLDSSGKPLVPLPQRFTRLHRLKLSETEQSVYDVLFARSRSTLQSYLKQQEAQCTRGSPAGNPFDKGAEQFKLSQQKPLVKASKDAPPVSTTIHILSLLLRLRQCCCHLSLLKLALDQANLNSEGISLSLEEQLSSLTLSEPDSDSRTMVYLFGTAFNTDVFEDTKQSTKLSHLLEELKAIQHCSQKCVIVSQWTSMLKVVAVHLRRLGLKYATVDGSVNPKQRMDMVEEFNSNPKGPEVILVSLLAGGVGLNLVGGNHLFLLDMHWNPALEDQACDRIYRVGQRNDVTIHRFVCERTVEEKILELQTKKKELAQKVLSGRGDSFTKLTLADLKLLFGF